MCARGDGEVVYFAGARGSSSFVFGFLYHSIWFRAKLTVRGGNDAENQLIIAKRGREVDDCFEG